MDWGGGGHLPGDATVALGKVVGTRRYSKWPRSFFASLQVRCGRGIASLVDFRGRPRSKECVYKVRGDSHSPSFWRVEHKLCVVLKIVAAPVNE